MHENLPESAPETPRRGSRAAGFILMAAGLLLILIFGFDLPAAFISDKEEVVAAPEVGSPAPDFTLNDINGSPVKLSSLRGKSVVLNFWATWCIPCMVEMPFLQSRYEQHSGELAILAINFDESAELVSDFANEFGLSFSVLLDPGAIVQDLYELRAYPSTYFVDPEGVIRAIRIGILSEDGLDEYLAEIGIQ